MPLSIVQVGPGFVSEVEAVDLRRLSDTELGKLLVELRSAAVLRIRGQALDIEGFLAFAGRFGELDDAPDSAFRGDHPKLAVVSNIIRDGRAIGSLGAGEARWHTDMSYQPLPPRASILYAVQVPPDQGDTWFVDMEQAYRQLPDWLSERVAGLSCKHDGTRNSTGALRPGFRVDADYTDEDRPGAVHPLVIAHPVTGRPALYLGRRLNAGIPELSRNASERLLDALWAQVADSPAIWVQRWQAGDVLIWDNQRVMHRRDAFDPAAERLMHRAQVRGQGPLAAFDGAESAVRVRRLRHRSLDGAPA
jgi:taurine dioxygenase